MRQGLVTLAAVALLTGAAAFSARAGDPPPAPPSPPAPPPAAPPGPPAQPPPAGTPVQKKPAKPPVPEVFGVRWEPDLESGLRRAAREGRPVFLAVNALEGEGANEMLSREAYPSQAWGKASRPFVCFVGNNETHDEKVGPDGAPTCPRFGVIPCKAHKDAIAFIVRRFGSLISPQHAILEPDGGTAYHKDYYTGEEGPPFLDRWAVAISPRLAVRRIWTAREQRMKTLSEASAADMKTQADAWIGSGDASYATVGVVALLDQEHDAGKRASLFASLKGAPPEAASVLFDPVDAATSVPDSNPEDAIRWVDVALAAAPDIGDWAAARIVCRAKDKALVARARERWAKSAGAKAPDVAAMPGEAAFRLGEALLLRGESAAGKEVLDKAKEFDVRPFEHRGTRAYLAAGLPVKSPTGPWFTEGGDRDLLRDLLLQATPKRVREELADVKHRLTDPVEEIRVAAAVALRRAGDASGADLLLAALGDPVEGPEVRHALVAWHGEDLGDDPANWDAVVRAEGGGK